MPAPVLSAPSSPPSSLPLPKFIDFKLDLFSSLFTPPPPPPAPAPALPSASVLVPTSSLSQFPYVPSYYPPSPSSSTSSQASQIQTTRSPRQSPSSPFLYPVVNPSLSTSPNLQLHHIIVQHSLLHNNCSPDFNLHDSSAQVCAYCVSGSCLSCRFCSVYISTPDSSQGLLFSPSLSFSTTYGPWSPVNDTTPQLDSHCVSPPLTNLLTTSEGSPASALPSPSGSLRIPIAPSDLAKKGVQTASGSWRCGHPTCSSNTVFRRGCDLRKHYKRHNKIFFCRFTGCPQSTPGFLGSSSPDTGSTSSTRKKGTSTRKLRYTGFSSRKDLLRHEAKHNPEVMCEWPNCDRIFSRVDNMRDHVRRIHKKCAPARKTSDMSAVTLCDSPQFANYSLSAMR